VIRQDIMVGPAPIEIATGFESTFLPSHDRDVMETTGHDRRWRRDLQLVRAAGVRSVRYPIRWHRVQPAPGVFDWRHTDEVLAAHADLGLRPIVDLVHHTSYPAWLTDGFADPRFRDAYLAYVEAFFERYPDTQRYTLFNEPFSTLFLCGHEAIWPPYHRGIEQFVAICGNVIPALVDACQLAADLAPDAAHIWVDACEHHTGAGDAGSRYADFANDRRFFVLDAVLGRLTDDDDRPFARAVAAAGGASLFDLTPGSVDVVGLDYYAHCQWHFPDGEPVVPTPTPVPLADQIATYADRYQLPVALTETNLRGTGSDRASWFKYVLEQCECAAARGVDVRSLCWFPFIDSADWDSLLYRCEGSIDPVGVYWLDRGLERRSSSFTHSFVRAAHGTPAAALPAYEFQEPAASWLAGYRPHMAHWNWQAPPATEHVAHPDRYDFELRIPDVA
jgi:beta-glucosidase/6-phospho-beta-glucosidase/beta-galactosidase